MSDHDNDDDGLTVTEEEMTRHDMTAALAEKRGGAIGLAGAHRTGKTTLAALMAKENPSIPFLKTSTKQIADAYGFDVDKLHDFEDRLAFQEIVLLHYQGIWEKQHGMFFTDRTPADFAGYLLSDVPQGYIEPFTERRIEAYLDRCVATAFDHFMAIIVVQPGIPYIETPGSPRINLAYQEKVGGQILGFCRSFLKRPHFVIDRRVTDLHARGRIVSQIVSRELGNLQGMLSWLPCN